MKYFRLSNQDTPESIKAQYKKLCIKHHPDKGGSTADFVAMKEEYISILSNLNGKPKEEPKEGQKVDVIDALFTNLFGDKIDPLDAIIEKLEGAVSKNKDLSKCVQIFKILINKEQ
jgi:hypothetical protein